MIGIVGIAGYIPENRVSNNALAKEYGLEEKFLHDKIGVLNHSIMDKSETALTMCLKAFEELKHQVNIEKIDVVAVITQNRIIIYLIFPLYCTKSWDWIKILLVLMFL